MPIAAPTRWRAVSLIISIGTKKSRSTPAHTNAIQFVPSNSLFHRPARARISSNVIRVTADSWLCQIPRASSPHESPVMSGSHR